MKYVSTSSVLNMSSSDADNRTKVFEAHKKTLNDLECSPGIGSDHLELMNANVMATREVESVTGIRKYYKQHRKQIVEQPLDINNKIRVMVVSYDPSTNICSHETLSYKSVEDAVSDVSKHVTSPRKYFDDMLSFVLSSHIEGIVVTVFNLGYYSYPLVHYNN